MEFKSFVFDVLVDSIYAIVDVRCKCLEKEMKGKGYNDDEIEDVIFEFQCKVVELLKDRYGIEEGEGKRMSCPNCGSDKMREEKDYHHWTCENCHKSWILVVVD